MLTNKKKENVVVVFAKRPEIGKVKTRIAEETSIRFACEFARLCFIDLVNKISNSDYYDLIVAVDSTDDLFWFKSNFTLEGMVVNWKKGGDSQRTQSNKFENIFSTLLAKDNFGYKKAILIPMDVPFLSQEDLITVFARLEQIKFVHGPEINGGVYLIGIRGPYEKGLFDGIRWSTSESFQDLVKNCGQVNTFFLKLRNDLNMPGDILRSRDEIYHNCPNLYRFLKNNGYYLSLENRFIDFDDLSICIPVVSNLVEKRDRGGRVELLIQTRYKPTIDPKNTGKIEVPSGLIKKHELAQKAAIRETEEETGIITGISNDQQIVNYIKQKNGDIVAVFRPFCCHQQLKGDRAYISLAFISKYIKGKLNENPRENREPRWMSIKDIKKMVAQQPENIFSLTLAILKEYLSYKNIT